VARKQLTELLAAFEGTNLDKRKMEPEPALQIVYDHYMIEEVPELKALSPTQFQSKLWEVPDPAIGKTYVRRVEDLYAAQHGYQPVVDKFDVPIEWGDIRTLRRSSQGVFCIVNDEIINFYMQLLADRSKGKKYHFFNSFFISHFMDKTYPRSRIVRWTKSKNISGAKSIFDLEKIFVPINLANVHWALIVVFPQTRKVISTIALRLPVLLSVNLLSTCYAGGLFRFFAIRQRIQCVEIFCSCSSMASAGGKRKVKHFARAAGPGL
jgi:hypothetical protein